MRKKKQDMVYNKGELFEPDAGNRFAGRHSRDEFMKTAHFSSFAGASPAMRNSLGI